MITKVVDLMSTRGAPSAPAPTTPGAVVAAPPTTVAVPVWHQLVRRYGGLLIDAASEGQTAADVAEDVYAYVPQRHLPILAELAAQPNVAGVLMTELPGLQPYGGWVNQFIDALRVVLAEPEAPDGDTEGEIVNEPTMPG